MSPSEGVIFSPLVTGVDVEAATSNSNCLPQPRWLDFSVSQGHLQFIPYGILHSKPHPLWLAMQESPTHRMSTLWTNGMSIMWKASLYPPSALLLLLGMCRVYASNYHEIYRKKYITKKPAPFKKHVDQCEIQWAASITDKSHKYLFPFVNDNWRSEKVSWMTGDPKSLRSKHQTLISNCWHQH